MAFVLTTIECLPLPGPQKRAWRTSLLPDPKSSCGHLVEVGTSLQLSATSCPTSAFQNPREDFHSRLRVADCFSPMWTWWCLCFPCSARGAGLCSSALLPGASLFASQTHLSHGLNKSNDFCSLLFSHVRAGMMC